MGAGVAGAIKRAGGSEIEAEAMAQGPIEISEAVATGGGSLHATHVIHGAVMGQDLRTNADLVSRTTRRVLEVADELGARSLGLPAFGTGVGGFPLEECAAIMVREVRAYEPRTSSASSSRSSAITLRKPSAARSATYRTSPPPRTWPGRRRSRRAAPGALPSGPDSGRPARSGRARQAPCPCCRQRRPRNGSRPSTCPQARRGRVSASVAPPPTAPPPRVASPRP